MELKELSSVWIQEGSSFKLSPNDFVTMKSLEPGIYNLCKDGRDNLYLELKSPAFSLPEKIYDMETEFIDYVIKTYNNINKNLGIMLHGYQGTGKTVTAKIICNTLKLPVIVINFAHPGLPEFISAIPNSCIMLFDEFEKCFRENTQMLLSIIDGTYTSDVKHMFLMTANTMDINRYFQSRPSRIRYIKEFYSIGKQTVIEYCNDHLRNKELLPELLRYMQRRKMLTMDILASVVEEVNIHGINQHILENVFNASYCEFNVSTSRFGFQLPPTVLTTNDALKFVDVETAIKVFEGNMYSAYSSSDKDLNKDIYDKLYVPALKKNGMPCLQLDDLRMFSHMGAYVNCNYDPIEDYEVGDEYPLGYRDAILLLPFDKLHKIAVSYDPGERMLCYSYILSCTIDQNADGNNDRFDLDCTPF